LNEELSHLQRVHIGGVMVSMFASSAVDHWKLSCSRHDIAEKLLSWHKTSTTHSFTTFLCKKTIMADKRVSWLTDSTFPTKTYSAFYV
jgi:hypothetical protein